ncbi:MULTISPECIES: YceI family protein [Olivibacter]|jgi:polyisoprenoid-binding protein YceI|uniref:YceI family protein n=1 Tax=Olivibacter oleidegradans TaxID=760123 RepID=A0ABV6HGD7_9SPHI|nr:MULTISPECIES: YceI family protein [Olivibacter]MDM8177827.1 YceI family protein [Olivibacter sp. 47]QEK99524.1 YceI family protein [Olivibacter sp. LS-1]
MKTQKFKVITPQSNIDWVGKKVTGAHNGTISIKEGEIILNEGKLTGGKFIIDTNSIKILDVTDPTLNAQFFGHLASDDFFSSEKYPEAILDITSVTDSHVEGNLTIKGITHPISFNTVVNVNGDTLTATGLIIVDRTKYGMKFRSGNFFQNLGDTLIYNEFELNIKVTAKVA